MFLLIYYRHLVNSLFCDEPTDGFMQGLFTFQANLLGVLIFEAENKIFNHEGEKGRVWIV